MRPEAWEWTEQQLVVGRRQTADLSFDPGQRARRNANGHL